MISSGKQHCTEHHTVHFKWSSMLVDQSRKKDLQLFSALHGARGTDSHTKQTRVEENWISNISV